MTSVETVSTTWPAIERQSTEFETDMLEHAKDIAGIVWKMYSMTVYDEDSGKESIRLRHYFEGPITADQEIRFEVVFRSESDPFTDRKVMESDSGTCSMIENKVDTRFWTQSAGDGYYKCDGETCGTLAAPSYPTPDKFQADTTIDWVNPVLDDDENNPFCTKYTD